MPLTPVGSTASRSSPQVASMRVASAASHDSNASPGIGSTRTGSNRLAVLAVAGSCPLECLSRRAASGSGASPELVRFTRTADLGPHFGTLLFRGCVDRHLVEQFLVDTFSAGAYCALTGAVDQGRAQGMVVDRSYYLFERR